MRPDDLMDFGKKFREEVTTPTLLFEREGHRVYWLGIPEPTAFRSNCYLIVDNDEAVIVDPGGISHVELIRDRIAQIIPPERVIAQILTASEPDAAGSFPEWVGWNSRIRVITTPWINMALSHYRDVAYESHSIVEYPEFGFTSGRLLAFFPSPFLPAPGSFVAFDQASGYLFSGDVGAAVDMEWKLVVEDFQQHLLKLNLYHLDAMASRIAVHGFLRRIRHLSVLAILPHHGSIIPPPLVPDAMEYLEQLLCGTDLYYPDIK